jgi:ABC-type Fe3+/spermidine/putrescine transport system ATPase subunit
MTPVLEVSNLEVRFPSFTLQEVSFTVEEGEFFLVLGPSGAGKTVLLETLAGIHRPRQGRIRLEGGDLTSVPPEERPIGIVYQDYALFPHLTVEENIRYALRFRRGRPAFAWQDWVGFLGLGPLLSRYPATLSGGEQQRVALARALAAFPRLLLLDEPLSALDPDLRGEIGRELRRLNQEFGLTIIMVTHDFSEVFAYGRRVAVLFGGRLLQVGTPEEVFRRPASAEVAGFVGMENLLPLEPREGSWFLLGKPVHPGAEAVQGAGAPARPGPAGVVAGVRPEDVVIGRSPLPYPYSWEGQLQSLVNGGGVFRAEVRVGTTTLSAYVPGRQLAEEGLRVGERVYVGFACEHVCFLEARGGL